MVFGRASTVSDVLMSWTVLIMVVVRDLLWMTWPHSVLRVPMHCIRVLIDCVTFLNVVTRHTILVPSLLGDILIHWCLKLVRLWHVIRVLITIFCDVVHDNASSTMDGLFVRKLYVMPVSEIMLSSVLLLLSA